MKHTLASSSTGYTLHVPSTRNIESKITSRVHVKSELPGTLLNVARDTVTWVNSKKYELYKNNTPVPIM